MAASKNNFINHLLELNKFKNIYDTKKRYPKVELNAIRAEGDPELILLPSDPYPFKEKHISEMQEFAHKIKIILVDGEMFSWYGSRLLKAFDYFKKLHSRIN